MDKSNAFSKFYVKYIINNVVVFYSFLGIGIAAFLFLSSELKLDVRKSMEAEVSGNSVILKDIENPITDVIYLYSNRNEKVHKLQITKIEIYTDRLICFVENKEKLSGIMNAEIVVGQQTLLERIFVKAGKG